MTLRYYQQEAIDVLLDNMQQGKKRQLVSLPTGTGKTVVFSNLIEQAREQGLRGFLVLAHRDELISQACEKLETWLPGRSYGVVKGALNNWHEDIVVASVQTLGRYQRLAQVRRDFDLIIVDEAHHTLAPSYMRILEHFGAWQPYGAYVAGFTATPQREGLERLYSLVYHKGIKEMIDQDYLVPLEYVQVKTLTDINGVRLAGSDLNSGVLSGYVNNNERNMLVVDSFLRHAPDGKAIVFACDIKHAKDLACVFNTMGVRAECLYSGMGDLERRNILQLFRHGYIQVVTNCGILTEGYDDPSLDTVIMARPTLSPLVYTQMIGRGLRTYPGKTHCKVIDLVDNADSHNLISLPFLFPDLRFKGTLRKLGRKQPGNNAGTNPWNLPQLAWQVNEEDVDVFKQRLQINWVRKNNGLLFKSGAYVVRVVNENGWYYPTIEKKRGDQHKSFVLSSAHQNERDAQELAEVYIVQARLIKRAQYATSHEENPKFQRLLELLLKLPDLSPYLTEKERELVAVFIDKDKGAMKITRTANHLNCSHTNVWQRLYGGKASEDGGILKKLQAAAP